MFSKSIIGRALCLLLLVSGTLAAQPSRPNIIFLLADDHRYDALGARGNRIISTPCIDRLAGDGTLFKNAYVTTSICSVSRASIFSGQYMSRHGIDDFAKNFSEEALALTYPSLLQKAGYTVGFVGKYGVGNDPPQDKYAYWKCTDKGQPPYLHPRGDGSFIHDTDTIAHSVADFLMRFGKEGPFCLSVNFKAPHELDGNPPAYPVQERFKTLYRDVTIPYPATYGPEFWEKHPDFFKNDENIGRVRWKPLFSTPELYQQTVKDYYRLVSGVDEVVGKIRDQLKALSIDDNTVIIYMGDNGFCLGEHGLQGKWFGFEESIRVPLIVYDPRSKPAKGKEVDEMVLNIDLAPTILELAGMKAPDRMQGRSLTPLMGNSKLPKWRQDFFYEHTFLGSPRLPKTAGVVQKDWKYIIYTEHGYETLFNLKKDRYETENLASDLQYKKQLNRLREKYSRYREEVR